MLHVVGRNRAYVERCLRGFADCRHCRPPVTAARQSLQPRRATAMALDARIGASSERGATSNSSVRGAPVGARSNVDDQRDAQLVNGLHGLSNRNLCGFYFGIRHFEHEFVVNR